MIMMRTDCVEINYMKKDYKKLIKKIKGVNDKLDVFKQDSSNHDGGLTENVIVYVSKESTEYLYQIFDDGYTFYVESTDGMTRTELRKIHEIVTEFIGGGQDE